MFAASPLVVIQDAEPASYWNTYTSCMCSGKSLASTGEVMFSPLIPDTTNLEPSELSAMCCPNDNFREFPGSPVCCGAMSAPFSTHSFAE